MLASKSGAEDTFKLAMIFTPICFCSYFFLPTIFSLEELKVCVSLLHVLALEWCLLYCFFWQITCLFNEESLSWRMIVLAIGLFFQSAALLSVGILYEGSAHPQTMQILLVLSLNLGWLYSSGGFLDHMLIKCLIITMYYWVVGFDMSGWVKLFEYVKLEFLCLVHYFTFVVLNLS